MALVPFPSAHSAPPEKTDSRSSDALTEADDIDQDELDGGGARMSFLEHLDELRNRLIHAVVAVCVGVGLTFFFHEAIYNFVFEPTRRVLPEGSRLMYNQPGEAFSLHIQIALI